MVVCVGIGWINCDRGVETGEGVELAARRVNELVRRADPLQCRITLRGGQPGSMGSSTVSFGVDNNGGASVGIDGSETCSLNRYDFVKSLSFPAVNHNGGY